jgi:FtsP/CotA-like multicopper oxidase with cupredoxin domain
MRPGEVQRWRLLAAGSGEIFVVALCNNPQITPQHPQCVVPPGGSTVPRLNIIANDGITIPKMRPLAPGDPYVMGSGQRADLLVKAGPAGNTYYLMALNPAAPKGWSAVSGSGIDPAPRQARISFDTPLALPAILATIVVSGTPINMQLPVGPLPVPKGLPRIKTMLDTPPNAERHIAFENCGDQKGVPLEDPKQRLPTCGWYFDRYDADYWGGTLFHTLLMMRDDDDKGVPNPSDPEVPLVNFQKEGLFTHHEPLFDDMIAGNFEEWTVVNRSFSDHTFHIHQNPFLLTHLNGKRLPVPEWHDTIIVPAAELPGGVDPPGNINTATFGSITFRTHFAPETVGSFVMHCHMLQHEDIGMMQRLKILPRKPHK